MLSHSYKLLYSFFFQYKLTLSQVMLQFFLMIGHALTGRFRFILACNSCTVCKLMLSQTMLLFSIFQTNWMFKSIVFSEVVLYSFRCWQMIEISLLANGLSEYWKPRLSVDLNQLSLHHYTMLQRC